MNKDINRTLMALVPILRMNGEMVKSIEAVNDWYKIGDREYLKEVAEITYDNGARKYADIGCDSNLAAVYDVVGVIQQIKPHSSAIERIERGVYGGLMLDKEKGSENPKLFSREKLRSMSAAEINREWDAISKELKKNLRGDVYELRSNQKA